jgi:ABC-type nitrate/sulfonate/bicarbonate transport system substrate-binding protein
VSRHHVVESIILAQARVLEEDRMRESKLDNRIIRILFALGFLSWVTLGEADAQLQKVRISYSASSSFIAFQAAMAQGFYKEEGLDVELIQVNSRLAPIALASGSDDEIAAAITGGGRWFLLLAATDVEPQRGNYRR